MLVSDLSEQALANCGEIGAELQRMQRRYADTGSIDLGRYASLAQLDVLMTATAAIAGCMARCDAGPVGRNGHAN